MDFFLILLLAGILIFKVVKIVFFSSGGATDSSTVHDQVKKSMDEMAASSDPFNPKSHCYDDGTIDHHDQ